MRFWGSASLMLLAMAATTFAQAPGAASTSPKPAVHRKFNELTLAGLRPGRDKVAKAIQMFGKPNLPSQDNQSLYWAFVRPEGNYFLTIEVDKSRVVQSVRVATERGRSELALPKAGISSIETWGSGRGLTVGANASRVVRLYGEPDSRSPSTKGGRKLELLYYAFDWAGADVPQVMEVTCTIASDGKPGLVDEITLAAPSL
jgi:hypothetical protein